MAGLYRVPFLFYGERADADFGFESNAVAFAEHVSQHEGVTTVRVLDEFDRDENGYPKTVWEYNND